MSRVFLTGGYGFLGTTLYQMLKDNGHEVWAPTSTRCNLLKFEDCLEVLSVCKPDVVIHSAARYGGLGINLEIPEAIFYINTVMNANIVRASALVGVKKFVGIGTACSYPGYLGGVLKEEDLWNGGCHETVACYGSVKKMMIIHCQAAFNEYGMNSIHPILANLYGPRDSFNPRRSHVVAALLMKFLKAKWEESKEVVCWGTGTPEREFLYVYDAAEAILKLMEKDISGVVVVNVGTGVATSIKDLAEMIAEVAEFEGEIVWDTSRPDGQKKKVFDVSYLKSLIGEVPPPIDKKRLKITYDWLEKNYDMVKNWVW